MKNTFNRKSQLSFRRALRQEMTAPERLLWQQLRAIQTGVKFRRQHGIGPYIVDFYCPRLRLVLEVDGDSHFMNEAAQIYDLARTRYLSRLGVDVLRFTNQEVMHNLDGVLAVIMERVSVITPSPPPP
ncbi:endonuclease domain-containing protein [Oceanimonas baumannii]|uniref:endonuclease domain-containing protein n=1 Tax=Oceanimonas baumannii TaxID=129578 RepID=UPI001D184A74|nr:endonuclease domain-containing protein [Oceanimonas baumannii]MCC4264575.1 endonuclease domain-containing protein [Oceanimonas baumannii]